MLYIIAARRLAECSGLNYLVARQRDLDALRRSLPLFRDLDTLRRIFADTGAGASTTPAPHPQTTPAPGAQRARPIAT